MHHGPRKKVGWRHGMHAEAHGGMGVWVRISGITESEAAALLRCCVNSNVVVLGTVMHVSDAACSEAAAGQYMSPVGVRANGVAEATPLPTSSVSRRSGDTASSTASRSARPPTTGARIR